MKDQAIVLTAFGTSTAARDTYAFFEEKLIRRFPDCDIFWSFSSKILRGKMAAKELRWQSPEQVLRSLKSQGYRRAVIQSLHVVPGIEFEKVISAAEAVALDVCVGRPLLSSEEDCRRTVEALSEQVDDPETCMTVFVGHGTRHRAAGSRYMRFCDLLIRAHPRGALVCMVEGAPSWDEIRHKIQASSFERIRFVPLMFVAGEHMRNDVMGEHAESWKAQLGNRRVEAALEGLGYNEKVQEIYFDHIYEAMGRPACVQ